MKQTQSLASVVLKHSKSPHKNSIGPIPRILKKTDLAIVTLKEPEMKTFKGEKKPNMSDQFAGVLPLKMLCNQFIMVKRIKFNDFKLIKKIITKSNTPDFGGYYIKQMQ